MDPHAGHKGFECAKKKKKNDKRTKSMAKNTHANYQENNLTFHYQNPGQPPEKGTRITIRLQKLIESSKKWSVQWGKFKKKKDQSFNLQFNETLAFFQNSNQETAT